MSLSLSLLPRKMGKNHASISGGSLKRYQIIRYTSSKARASEQNEVGIRAWLPGQSAWVWSLALSLPGYLAWAEGGGGALFAPQFSHL